MANSHYSHVEMQAMRIVPCLENAQWKHLLFSRSHIDTDCMPITDPDDLSRLLAEGRITAITIDTSIFDEKRLRLNSAVLQALARFKNRRFSFILSGTVSREVLRHLKDAAENGLRSAKKALGDALNVFETERPTRAELMEQISGGMTAAEAAQARFDAYIEATGCEILDDAALVDLEAIINAYFTGEPPFGSGTKKSEFPDALALGALEHRANGRQTEFIVVSKDSDWRAFCEGSQRLHLLPDIERALSLINDAPLVLRETLQAWLEEEQEGRTEILARLVDEIERTDFYVDGHPTSGEMEAIAWEGQLTDVDWPAEDDIDIIDVTDSENGDKQVILSVPLLLKVRIPVELSFSVWDSIDKESISMGGRTIEVEEDQDVRATVTLKILGLGEEDEALEIIDFEMDDLDNEINIGSVDVFEEEDAWPEDI